MGFASKLSMNFFPKNEGGVAPEPGTVLASPDTQFGVGTLAAAPETVPAGNAETKRSKAVWPLASLPRTFETMWITWE